MSPKFLFLQEVICFSYLETLVARFCQCNYSFFRVKINIEHLPVHGNYCGPGWSDGKYQESVCGSVDPIDNLDRICKQHDCDYANDEDLYQSDLNFIFDLLNTESVSPQSIITLLPVAIQAGLRRLGVMARRRGKKKQSVQARTVKRVTPHAAKILKRVENSAEKRILKDIAPVAYAPNIGKKNMRRMKVKVGKNSMRATGSEILMTIASSSSQKVGDILGTFALAPQNLAGTRLQTLSTLFERYDPKFIRFKWIPIVGTNFSANVVMAVDPDPSDSVSGGTLAAVSKAINQGGKDLAVWEKKEFTFRREKKQQTLYTSLGADPRLYSFGTFYVVCNSIITSQASLGQIIIDYDFEFYKPTIEGGNMGVTNVGVLNGSASTTAQPFVNWSLDNNSDFSPSVDSTNSVITVPLPVGSNFYVFYTQATNNCTGDYGAFKAVTNCTALNSFNSHCFTATTIMAGALFFVSGANPTISLSNNASGINGTITWRLMIAKTRDVSLFKSPIEKMKNEVDELRKEIELLKKDRKTEESDEDADDKQVLSADELIRKYTLLSKGVEKK